MLVPVAFEELERSLKIIYFLKLEILLWPHPGLKVTM